jgi:serpin B
MHRTSVVRLLVPLVCIAPVLVLGAPTETPAPEIAPAINSLGLDLYREQIKSAGGAGVLLSPYAIATALAIAYTGAAGTTKVEMQRVLYLPNDPAACSAAFQSLAAQLSQVVRASEQAVANRRKHSGDATPVELQVANRIFVQQGYALRPAFAAQLQQHFNSELAQLDFLHAPAQARQVINQWVTGQTHDKIRDLLPAGQPTTDTRLALVNALYLRAAWQDEFPRDATQPEAFHFIGATAGPVPMMRALEWYGYAKRDGYSVVTLPYLGEELQFVLLVPDAPDGLQALEKSLSAKALMDCVHLNPRRVNLHLPKFKLEPVMTPLAAALQALGLKTAFDLPRGSANFDRMAPRKPDDYLYIGAVFHKTWLSLDENGTEAAAATAVLMTFGLSASSPNMPPLEIRADRPFLFAIQHVESGACLFLGRVTDPRAN